MITKKMRKCLDVIEHTEPVLVVDLNVVRDSYVELQDAFNFAHIFYAVKANPAEQIVSLLVHEGASFDCASLQEIDLVIECGGNPRHISFGNTIKKEQDIAAAYQRGVELYAVDSMEEMLKVSRAAPGRDIYCRIVSNGQGADWPLSRKFGCESDMAAEILIMAKKHGLNPRGVSFHVGSQQRNIAQWEVALSSAASVFQIVKQHGIKLDLINMGGGFPAHYHKEAPPLKEYEVAIKRFLSLHFGEDLPQIILEPGRSLVADAGVIRAEVVLISQKSFSKKERRWVYLDIGKFNGLAETMEEAIVYKIQTMEEHHGVMEDFILAGPTCDSADVLYEKTSCLLPGDLRIGEKILLENTGSYTQSYSSVFFNGFPPLSAIYIE